MNAGFSKSEIDQMPLAEAKHYLDIITNTGKRAGKSSDTKDANTGTKRYISTKRKGKGQKR